MDVFDLAARITLDSSGFESGIGNAKNKMQGFVSDAGKFLGDIAKVSAAAVGAAAAGAAAITKAAVGSFADYQQLTGGIETLFKGSSDVVKQYADEAYKTAGLSANDYMETATSFAASLISGLNGDTEEAARLTQIAITDMSDNANKMGSSIQSIQNAYQGFAKQNFTMLDNLKLGYGGTQAEMYRLMQTAAELDETFAQTAEFSLDSKGHLEAEFADIVQAIHLVQEEMGITGTTAAEAAATVSGSVSTMKAAWENWLTGLGTKNADMSGLTQNLIDSFMTVKDNVEPVLRTIADNAVAVFNDLTGIDLSPAVEKIRNFGTAAQEIFTDLSNAYKEGGISGVVDNLTGKFEDLTKIDLSPITQGVRDFFRNFSESSAGESLSGAVDSVGKFISTFTDNGDGWIGVLNGAAEGTGKLLAVFGEKTGGFVSAVADGFSNLVDTLTENDVGQDLLDAAGAMDEAVGKIEESSRKLEKPRKDIENFFTTGLSTLGGSVGAVASLITGSLQPTVEGFNGTVDIFVGLLTFDMPQALDGFKTSLQATVTEFQQLWNAAKQIAGEIGKLLTVSVWDPLARSNGYKSALDQSQQEAYWDSKGLRQEAGVTRQDLFESWPLENVSFQNSSIGKSTSAAINSALVSSGSGDPININVNIDGKTAASALYDPMNGIAKQRDK